MKKIPLGYTIDVKGNELTYKNSNGRWRKYTRDTNGDVLTYKDSCGFWRKYTRDDNGNELSFKDSDNRWREYTRDDNGNELAFKDSHGRWREYTRDDNGNELTYSNSDGFSVVVITTHAYYTLYQDVNTKLFTAGCRVNLTLEEALAHWDRTDARAVLFTKALKELQANEM
jgi:hypothetical protein